MSSTLSVRANIDENESKSFLTKKILKEPKSKSVGRRPLQVLQPSAATQTQLVGGNGTPRSVDAKKGPDGKIDKEAGKDKPKTDASTTLATPVGGTEDARIVKRPIETRSIEVQTDLTSFSGELDHAEQIAYMTSLTGDADRLRKIAEDYLLEIAEVSAENDGLKAKNAELEAENVKLAEERQRVFTLAEEAKQIIEMAEPLLAAMESKPEESADETEAGLVSAGTEDLGVGPLTEAEVSTE